MSIGRGNLPKTTTGPGTTKKPKQEKYIGTYIDGDLGGIKVSNPSYKKYYKGMI
tara:strand:+ start:514 stop:675 length:162 start_codon:yes stop_codon:yes gene_type:complete